MSRRLGDSEALVTALHARHWALGSPEMIQERLENTREMLALAAETGNQEFAFLAHNSRFHCFLELCDGPAIDTEIAAVGDLAEHIDQPFYRWHAVCLQVIRAVLDGRFADAERLAQNALHFARVRRSEYAGYVYEYAQLIAIYWAQGVLGEHTREVEEHSERFLWIPRWRDALAAAEGDDLSAATAEIERQAARGFEDLERDGFWLLRLCSLADACVTVGDERRAQRIYELLQPFADRNATALTQLPFGPVALRLAKLAALLERWDEAEAYFEIALERCELLGARAVRARVLLDYAPRAAGRGARGRRRARRPAACRGPQPQRGPRAPGAAAPDRGAASGARRPGARPRRASSARATSGRSPTRARRCACATSRGSGTSALLLARPGRELHVLELVAADGGPAPQHAEPRR